MTTLSSNCHYRPHDVNEAILLANRVVMVSNGPNAKAGKIGSSDLTRPKTRKNLLVLL